jgi:hypothetical protein
MAFKPPCEPVVSSLLDQNCLLQASIGSSLFYSNGYTKTAGFKIRTFDLSMDFKLYNTTIINSLQL